MARLVQKLLLKQVDIDLILKGIHLPMKIKEIQAVYLVSSYFKDIYLYLAQNKVPINKMAIKKVKVLAENYITRFIII